MKSLANCTCSNSKSGLEILLVKVKFRGSRMQGRPIQQEIHRAYCISSNSKIKLTRKATEALRSTEPTISPDSLHSSTVQTTRQESPDGTGSPAPCSRASTLSSYSPLVVPSSRDTHFPAVCLCPKEGKERSQDRTTSWGEYLSYRHSWRHGPFTSTAAHGSQSFSP